MKNIFLTCTFFVFTLVSMSQPSYRHAEKYLHFLSDKSVLFDTTRLVPVLEAKAVDVENAWKNWHTVENFTYGKDRGSLPMIADLNSLHPYFRDRIVELIHACREQGIELAVVESFRTHAKQSEYFGMGRKYTRSKGGKSKHQYGLAVDVVPIVDSTAMWDDVALWKRIGVAGEKLGLRWGGRWRSPYDPAHFEWAGGMNTDHLAQGIHPHIPHHRSAAYPCINEDIALLMKYYEAWETEQAVSARNGETRFTNAGATGQKP